MKEQRKYNICHSLEKQKVGIYDRNFFMFLRKIDYFQKSVREEKCKIMGINKQMQTQVSSRRDISRGDIKRNIKQRMQAKKEMRKKEEQRHKEISSKFIAQVKELADKQISKQSLRGSSPSAMQKFRSSKGLKKLSSSKLTQYPNNPEHFVINEQDVSAIQKINEHGTSQDSSIGKSHNAGKGLHGLNDANLDSENSHSPYPPIEALQIFEKSDPTRRSGRVTKSQAPNANTKDVDGDVDENESYNIGDSASFRLSDESPSKQRDNRPYKPSDGAHASQPVNPLKRGQKSGKQTLGIDDASLRHYDRSQNDNKRLEEESAFSISGDGETQPNNKPQLSILKNSPSKKELLGADSRSNGGSSRAGSGKRKGSSKVPKEVKFSPNKISPSKINEYSAHEVIEENESKENSNTGRRQNEQDKQGAFEIIHSQEHDSEYKQSMEEDILRLPSSTKNLLSGRNEDNLESSLFSPHAQTPNNEMKKNIRLISQKLFYSHFKSRGKTSRIVSDKLDAFRSPAKDFGQTEENTDGEFTPSKDISPMRQFKSKSESVSMMKRKFRARLYPSPIEQLHNWLFDKAAAELAQAENNDEKVKWLTFACLISDMTYEEFPELKGLPKNVLIPSIVKDKAMIRLQRLLLQKHSFMKARILQTAK